MNITLLLNCWTFFFILLLITITRLNKPLLFLSINTPSNTQIIKILNYFFYLINVQFTLYQSLLSSILKLIWFMSNNEII